MSRWPRCASFLVAVALTVGSGMSATAVAQEDPTENPTIVLPPVPKEVGDRLPDDPQQRHPWVPNDAPWPWNMSIVQGSWQNPNSSITPVYCGPTVASQNPYWWQENLRYTQFSGGARCNVQMQSITGAAHLLQWNGPGASTPELTSAPIGSQHAVPAGYGSGWQAYAYGYYTRTSDDQNLQIRLDVRLELPPYGTSNGPARWNTVPNNCTRDANIRVVHCQLFSVPFRYAPYPCPSGRAGVQPVDCVSSPQPCPSPQIGMQPYCITLPNRPECSGPMYPDDNPDYQCPEDDDLPGEWGQEDGLHADLEDERRGIEEDTGVNLPGGPLPNASTASGNANNDSDPHFQATDSRCVYEPDGPQPACSGAIEWCNSGYRVRRRWCFPEYSFHRLPNPDHRYNITGSKRRGTNSKAVYVCVQMVKNPVYSGKAFETCNTNIAKTGYQRPPRPASPSWTGECEHFHVKRQWVWCNWHGVS